MTKPLSFDRLLAAVGSDAAAIRARISLEPAGGIGDKVFPPTYAGGMYAMEQRRLPDHEQPVDCVLLDSVQSQANRIEEALQDAIDDGRLSLPVVSVEFDGVDTVEPDSDHVGFIEPIGRVTSLQAPHRIADAILRDSEDFDGVPFRKTDAGKKLDQASIRDATPVYEICPTALLLGLWDSTGPKGGLGVKFQRALVSEIVGINAQRGVRTSSRQDPLGIPRAAEIYEAADGSGWTSEREAAKMAAAKKGGKKEPVLYKKEGKPSEANHSNIPPTTEEGKGGVTIDSALMTTVISIPALRRLRFPVEKASDHERNVAGRTVIAAIGLVGVSLALEQGLDLRSRCLLISESTYHWELVSTSGQPPEQFAFDVDRAIALLSKAVAHAEKHGLAWQHDTIRLRPTEKLIKLVQKGQNLASTKAAGESVEE